VTYISVLPKSEDVQSRLTENGDAVMDLLFMAAKEVLQIPDNDIIVELHRCTTIAFNRSAVAAAAAPDVVLTFVTSDHDLQPRFQTLCDRVVSGWNERFGDIRIEVSVSLLNAWGTNIQLD